MHHTTYNMYVIVVKMEQEQEAEKEKEKQSQVAISEGLSEQSKRYASPP